MYETKRKIWSLWSRSWFVNNPKIVKFEGSSGEQLDFFMLQKQKSSSIFEALINGGGKNFSFTCYACNIQIDNFQNTVKHCKHPSHLAKEIAKMEADGDEFLKEMVSKLETTIELNMITTRDVVKSDPTFAFIGLQYMLEIIPNECDEPSIYLCGLPFCEFRGVCADLKEHCSSGQHLKGYLDVYGVLEESNNNETLSGAKFLYEGDLATCKNPTRLIQRVYNTNDYNIVKKGRYPSCYHDLVQKIQDERADKLSKFNQAMSGTMTETDSSYDTRTSDSFDEKLPPKTSYPASDRVDQTFQRGCYSITVPPPPLPIPISTEILKQQLAKFRREIRAVVLQTKEEEFEVGIDKIDMLTAKLYQDELILHQAKGYQLQDLKMTEEIWRRVYARVRWLPPSF